MIFWQLWLYIVSRYACRIVAETARLVSPYYLLVQSFSSFHESNPVWGPVSDWFITKLHGADGNALIVIVACRKQFTYGKNFVGAKLYPWESRTVWSHIETSLANSESDRIEVSQYGTISFEDSSLGIGTQDIHWTMSSCAVSLLKFFVVKEMIKYRVQSLSESMSISALVCKRKSRILCYRKIKLYTVTITMSQWFGRRIALASMSNLKEADQERVPDYTAVKSVLLYQQPARTFRASSRLYPLKRLLWSPRSTSC